MPRCRAWRSGLRLLGLPILFVLVLAASAQAQPAAAPAPAPAQVQDLLKLLDDPAVRTWIKQRVDSDTAPSGPEAADKSVSEFTDRRLALTRQHLQLLASAVAGFLGEIRAVADRLSLEFAHFGLLKMLAVFAIFVALGFGFEALYFRLTEPIRQRVIRARVETPARRLRAILARFAYQLSVVAVFALGSIGAFLALDWPASVRALLLGYLLALLAVRIAVLFGRLLLAPSFERFRIIPMSDDAARFWHRRMALAVGVLAFGGMTVEIMLKLGFSQPARWLVGYTFGLGLLAVGIEAVWRQPRDRPIHPRPMAGHGDDRWLATLAMVVLWVLWVLGAMPAFWLVAVIALAPLLLRLVDKTVRHVMRPADGDALARPDLSIQAAMLDRGLRAGIVIFAALFLARMWDIDLIELTGRDTVAVRLLRGLLNAVVIIIVADMLWSIGKIVIDRRIAAGKSEASPDTEEGRRQARLRTLLPIARNFLFAIMLVVTLLMVLSALGVDIGPLVAGAGVFGVAIGFGAQTLVKDIISGVFYLLDDAFRVGEYIQSGSYKGTVESFSLRSVKLRHHRGPLYTVPFGQLGAVQNMSRDWVIDKLTVSVTYDTDLEKVKKLIKEIGATLKADPELGPHILETLKMQGVEQFGDYAIQIRLKMMTKPGEQFVIRRRAYALIKKAFDANGIRFAFPTVQVAGGGDAAATAAAAAQHETVRLKAAEATAE
jgi:moderate conductance mechanosensitive channel